MGESPPNQVFFELEGLISDALQVISYKWLSRRFSISSNIAKRLLDRFVTQNPQLDLEIVYAVSGYSKTDPECYTIQLVPKSKLEGARATLKENPSVHVYSVQRSLPKDPAQLWSVDFVQSLELFNEPPDVSNCLRDNRFSAVACEAVKRSLVRNSSGSTSSPRASTPDTKPPVGVNTHPTRPAPDSRQSSLFAQNAAVDVKPVKREIPTASPALANIPLKEADGDIKPVKNEPPGSEPNANGSKTSILSPATGKRKASGAVPPASGSGGGAISNLWGKAASKPKVPSPPRAPEPPAAPIIAGDAEASIQAMEADVYCDDDVEQHAHTSRPRKSTGRRRMIVEDDEEAEEMIVRLATPDSPQDIKPQVRNGQTIPTGTGNEGSEVHTKPVESKPSVTILQDTKTAHGPPPSTAVKKEEQAENSNGPRGGSKRKKVMHTRVDEKGREVTEVVWVTEGEESVARDEKPEVAATKHAAPTSKESETKSSAERSRALPKPHPVPSKAPAGKGGKNAGKSGGKQQGSIMSFFKKQ